MLSTKMWTPPVQQPERRYRRCRRTGTAKDVATTASKMPGSTTAWKRQRWPKSSIHGNKGKVWKTNEKNIIYIYITHETNKTDKTHKTVQLWVPQVGTNLRAGDEWGSPLKMAILGATKRKTVQMMAALGKTARDISGSEWCDDICFTTLRTDGFISYTKSALDIFDMFDVDGGNNDVDDDKENVC